MAPPGTFAHRLVHRDIKLACGIDAWDAAGPSAELGGWAPLCWVSVAFSHFMTRPEVDFLIRAVLDIARDGWKLLPQYSLNLRLGAL